MTDIQNKLLDILKEFDKICRRHGLEYFLTGGSSLGVMRHEGFIPWDDDIDLGMRRSVWEKARPILLEELPPNLVLVDKESYPLYRNPIAKIVDTGSTVLYRASLADECPKGQYIEVFTHDCVPADKVQEHKKDFLIYCELMTPYFSVFNEKLSYRKGLTDSELEILEEYLQEKERADRIGLDKVLAEYEARLGRYTAEESDYLLLGWGINSCYYPLENFESMKEAPFEDLTTFIPIRACDNLRIDYGNSWTDYPPAGQRFAHVTIGDENIGGDKYMDLILKQIDPEKTRKMRMDQKMIHIRAIPETVRRNKAMLLIQMRHAKVLDARYKDTQEVYKSGNYQEITERFAEYIILKKRAKNYTLGEDISMETRETIARSLLMLGRLTDAENVLDITRSMKVKAGDTSLANDILRITKANSCYYDDLPEEAKELLSAVDDELRSSLTYKKITMRMDISKGISPDDIFRLADKYPADYELKKIKADAMSLAGNKADADAIYDEVLAGTDNGMDILDITRKRADTK